MDFDENEHRLLRRDSGRGLLVVSAVAFAISLLALFKSLSIESYAYNAAADRAWWDTICNVSGATAGTTFLVGSVIRAIWFLPGDEAKPIRKLFRRGE
jgi:hypothetical protein